MTWREKDGRHYDGSYTLVPGAGGRIAVWYAGTRLGFVRELDRAKRLAAVHRDLTLRLPVDGAPEEPEGPHPDLRGV